MGWKKVNLFEYLGHKVFMDKYGFCWFTLQNILINDINAGEFYFYNKDGKRYQKFSSNFTNDVKNIFELKFAKYKPAMNAAYRYNYGYVDSFGKSEALPVNIKKITLVLRTNYYVTFGQNGGGSRQENSEERIELSGPNDIKKYECWYLEHADISAFDRAILSELKEKDELYLVGTGKVRITQMYNYPNKDNSVCDSMDIFDKHHLIKNDSELFYLPYENHIDEYDQLNQAKNELLLSPYVTRHDNPNHIYNVYWNEIKEASSYHVLLFKFIDRKNAKRILKIADYEVDRNTHYLALDNLAGRDFVFKVKAEDRKGNIISESRGIPTSGEPRYVNK